MSAQGRGLRLPFFSARRYSTISLHIKWMFDAYCIITFYRNWATQLGGGGWRVFGLLGCNVHLPFFCASRLRQGVKDVEDLWGGPPLLCHAFVLLLLLLFVFHAFRLNFHWLRIWPGPILAPWKGPLRACPPPRPWWQRRRSRCRVEAGAHLRLERGRCLLKEGRIILHLR